MAPQLLRIVDITTKQLNSRVIPHSTLSPIFLWANLKQLERTHKSWNPSIPLVVQNRNSSGFLPSRSNNHPKCQPNSFLDSSPLQHIKIWQGRTKMKIVQIGKAVLSPPPTSTILVHHRNILARASELTEKVHEVLISHIHDRELFTCYTYLVGERQQSVF